MSPELSGNSRTRHRSFIVWAIPALLLLSLYGRRADAQTGAQTALQQADTAFRAGYQAMQAGKLDEARQDFADVVRLAPQLPEGHVALGAILVRLERPQEAIPEFERALELKPGDTGTEANLATAHESVARSLAAAGKLSDAEAQLQAALGVLPQASPNPQGSELEDELGSLLAQEKRWSEAETAFREALRLSPADDKAVAPHMHLGVVLTEEKQFPAAIDELKQAAEGAPGNAATQFQLGRGLAAAGKDEEAEPHLKAALQLNPQLQGGAQELAMNLQRLGRQEESIPLFQQAIAQDSKNAQALTNLGLALTETGKARDAVPYFDRALAEAPNDPVVHEDLGVAELQQSHFDEAIAQFEKARELDSRDPQLHYDLGLAYKFKDRMDDATRELTTAEDLDPTLPDPPYTLGILLMQRGKLDEAATQLNIALTLRPANGDGWALLGSVLKQLDRRDEAEAALRKAITLMPNQPGPHITLAAVLAEEGQKDEAAAERKVAAGLSRTAVNRQRALLSTNAGNQSMQRGEITDAVSRYQDAIAADPAYAEAHAQLALAYARQGRAEEAAAEHAKAESLQKPN
jgi:tetratricopeptide (TPR) repeat protein